MSTSSISSVVSRIDEIIESVNQIKATKAQHAIEFSDLLEVTRSLSEAKEKLTEVLKYSDDPETDHDELWRVKSNEIKAQSESQKLWLRAEIFKVLLTGSE